MKRHPAMAANIGPGSQGETPESLSTQISAARPPTHTVPHLELTAGALRVRPAVRQRPRANRRRAAHTLLLSGRLDRSSAPRLEAEIERLNASGVREITLDLAQLTGIDFAGVAVIAFRRKWCRRHGCELAVVHGPSHIRLALEAAGIGELVRGDRGDAAVGSPDASLDQAGAAIIAAATPPSRAGRRIVARRADDRRGGAAPDPDATTTPLEEADAARA